MGLILNVNNDLSVHETVSYTFWQHVCNQVADSDLKLELLGPKDIQATSTMPTAWQSHSSLRAAAKGMSNAAQSSCRSWRGPKTRERILWKGWVGLCGALLGQLCKHTSLNWTILLLKLSVVITAKQWASLAYSTNKVMSLLTTKCLSWVLLCV